MERKDKKYVSELGVKNTREKKRKERVSKVIEYWFRKTGVINVKYKHIPSVLVSLIASFFLRKAGTVWMRGKHPITLSDNKEWITFEGIQDIVKVTVGCTTV